MADALLVADQHIDERFFAPEPRRGGGPGSWLGSWPVSQELDAFAESRQSADPQVPGGPTFGGDRKDINVYLRRAHKAVEHLAKSEHVRTARQFEEESRWLAENRNRFAGQWIALQGSRLLAVGVTAKEVFRKVADEKSPPLVILVDSGEPPFAGW